MEFETRYPCGRIEACYPLESDPLSNAFQIETATGTYLIKRHRPKRTSQGLDFEETLTSCLSRNGFNLIPLTVPTVDRRLHIVVDGAIWSVHDYVISNRPFVWTEPTWNQRHCREAGRALAHLHDLGDRCAAVMATVPDFQAHLGSVLASLPERFESALELVLCPANDPHDLTELIRDNRGSLTSDLENTLSEIEKVEGELGDEPVLVHGDYHPGNLLFWGESLTAVLDFEFAHQELRGYDLGYAAVMFCTAWSTAEGGWSRSAFTDGSIKKDYLDAFLSGYREKINLPAGGALIEALSSAERFCRVFSPYLRLACYLTIYWLAEQIVAAGKKELHARLRRALTHSLNTLSLLYSSSM